MSLEPKNSLLSSVWRGVLVILGIVAAVWIAVQLILQIWWVLVIIGLLVAVMSAAIWWWRRRRW